MDQFIRGTVADQMGDHYRAAFHYQEALRYDSASAFIYVALAQDYLLLGNPALAEEQLDKALRVDPRHLPALELKAVLLRGSGDVHGLRSTVERLVELAPRNTQYMRDLLSIDLAEKEYDDAERVYQRIVSIDGETDDLLKQVLTVYLMSDQPKRAQPLLQKLYARDSTDAAIIYSLGTIYLDNGDTTRGEAFLQRANRLEPNEPRFWLGLGVYALDRHDYPAAVALADSALAVLGPNAGLYTIKGNALSRMGDDRHAIEALEQAITIDTTLYTAMGALALVYDRLDSLEHLEQLYTQAIRLSDSAAVYLNNLAYAYAQRAVQLDRANTLVDLALKRAPENASYLDTKGWIEYQKGDYAEAVRWLKKAVDADGKNAEVLEHLGDAYAQKGSRSKANSCYKRALALDPQNERIRQKAGR
jgi:tetratricopeptide (TPR) repeat protein